MELKIKDSIVLYSEEDQELIAKYKWYINESGYCISTINKKNVRMHRFILNCPDDMVVDHINNNRLDNRRENLKITNVLNNNQNKQKQEGTYSSFVGVSWDKRRNKYTSQINVNRKHINLGYFEDSEKAAMARDMYIVHELPDSNYKLNFPDKRSEYVSKPYTKKIPKVLKLKPLTDKTEYECVEGTEEIICLLFPDNPDDVVLIDTEDYEKIRYERWWIYKGYVVGSGKILHRIIMEETNPKVFIDHIDGNKLNNTKANLRLSNAQLNSQNRQKQKNASSKYYGVSSRKIKNGVVWEAKVKNKGKSYQIGSFVDEQEAAQAYDDYIKENFPDSHYNLNFPDEE